MASDKSWTSLPNVTSYRAGDGARGCMVCNGAGGKKTKIRELKLIVDKCRQPFTYYSFDRYVNVITTSKHP